MIIHIPSISLKYHHSKVLQKKTYIEFQNKTKEKNKVISSAEKQKTG